MDYNKYRLKAFKKIKQYGFPLTVRKSGRKVFDEISGTYVDEGEILTGVGLQGKLDERTIDGKNVKYGDIIILACVNGYAEQNDSVTFKGKTYTVIDPGIVAPDGSTVICCKIHAR